MNIFSFPPRFTDQWWGWSQTVISEVGRAGRWRSRCFCQFLWEFWLHDVFLVHWHASEPSEGTDTMQTAGNMSVSHTVRGGAQEHMLPSSQVMWTFPLWRPHLEKQWPRWWHRKEWKEKTRQQGDPSSYTSWCSTVKPYMRIWTECIFERWNDFVLYLFNPYLLTCNLQPVS